ncbi:MAG: Ldh family oxidoreductase [Spirochaetaceae bacterium]|jgi:LDH2 family malate/lactate/ureidoglycolate dehydrogenase|nr:Ldh family oxidoreductase [Spirochaetaceae bacterium]
MIRIPRSELEQFCADIFINLNIPEEEAWDSAKILVAADARGIPSHGVAHLARYTAGIRSGKIKGAVVPTILKETPLSRTIDAEGAMGMSLSRKCMDWVIEKALRQGAGFCAVRNSNHFGIAGYYTEMAARQGCIGMAFCNTAALGVPTYARKPWFGTNPIAFAAPGEKDDLFSLDMATTTVTRGRIEVAAREGEKLHPSWAVGKNGLSTDDPVSLLDDMLYLRGGGLLPLGGEGDAGYKGFGLAVMVDILSALLSGGTFGEEVRDSVETSARVCHFFMAIDIKMFRNLADFKADMSRMLKSIRKMEPAEGKERVLYAGLRHEETEAENNRLGIPLSDKTWEALQKEKNLPK